MRLAMRLALMATCSLLFGSGACGRIGYDVVTSSGVGGSGGTGPAAGGAAGAGNVAGANGRAGAAGSGDGAVVVLSDAGSCPGDAGPCGGVRLQYHAGDTNKPTDPWIRPLINLFNDASTDVPLSELTVRYWYTIDTVAPQSFACDSAFVGAAGCANVTGAFASVSPPRAGADSVFEIGFLPAAGTLAAGGQTQPITLRFSKSDFSAYDETNDYSYGSWSTFTDAPLLTVYRDGALIWGIEP
jgi:hypothetical protein